MFRAQVPNDSGRGREQHEVQLPGPVGKHAVHRRRDDGRDNHGEHDAKRFHGAARVHREHVHEASEVLATVRPNTKCASVCVLFVSVPLGGHVEPASLRIRVSRQLESTVFVRLNRRRRAGHER